MQLARGRFGRMRSAACAQALGVASWGDRGSAGASAACAPRRRAARCAASAGAADALQQPASPPGPGDRSALIDLFEDKGARLTSAAQMAWAQVLRPGDTAVDATAGNGWDALALAELVGPRGRVWALDVQDAALASTRARLEAELPLGSAPELHLVRACHSRLQEVVGSVAARVVAFNLGYLPSGDKSLVTRAETTVAALEAALEVLQPGGLLTIMAYTGHPGGQEEYDAVKALLTELSPSFWVTAETRLVNRPTAPILLVVWRRSGAVAPGAGGQRRRPPAGAGV
ncbi:rRNA methylase [Raphidocelis subcapitata]|uniref:rRNA methylase n=1 Tax=Raphidocelis subcapitata TaxID=307507 RepID=A0A2V0P3F6_9CHLO|nr:rRNA methylase [Raphidocelis subcapitata]|eukprot:GBF94396.1 rRNA methylase [Raphidocelis subcapitata]